MRLGNYDWFEVVCIAAIGSLTLAMLVGFVLLLIPTETVTLRASEWDCTEHRTEGVTTLINVGKSLVPVTSIQDVCVEWRRK